MLIWSLAVLWICPEFCSILRFLFFSFLKPHFFFGPTKCHFIQWNHDRKNSRGRLRTRRRGQKKSSHFDHGRLTWKMVVERVRILGIWATIFMIFDWTWWFNHQYKGIKSVRLVGIYWDIHQVWHGVVVWTWEPYVCDCGIGMENISLQINLENTWFK